MCGTKGGKEPRWLTKACHTFQGWRPSRHQDVRIDRLGLGGGRQQVRRVDGDRREAGQEIRVRR